jgi:hypothetical protein
MTLEHIFLKSKQEGPREGDTVKIKYIYWVDKPLKLDKECYWYIFNNLYPFLLRLCCCDF